MQKPAPPHIILSRTDNLGDVVLSLPIAGYLKSKWPNVKISFLGKSYTRAIIENCAFVDAFLDRETVLKTGELQADVIIFLYPDKEVAQLSKQNKIELRIGTANRWYHWLYLNSKVFFSRKKSDLHEAQLNFKLLAPLGINLIPSLKEIPKWYGFSATQKEFIDKSIYEEKHIVLHPKSKGSAREWSMSHYLQLAKLLTETHYQVWVTGTAAEGQLILAECPTLYDNAHVHDMTGKLSLDELITFIGQVDGLVACSTGPLHIAAALGKVTVGLYPPRRPIHPGRWAALGKQVQILTFDKDCHGCPAVGCSCINSIEATVVFNILNEMIQKNN